MRMTDVEIGIDLHIRKLMSKLKERIANLYNILVTTDDKESDVEVPAILSRDENGNVGISEGWVVDEDVYTRAGAAITISKGWGVLMSALWNHSSESKTRDSKKIQEK